MSHSFWRHLAMGSFITACAVNYEGEYVAKVTVTVDGRSSEVSEQVTIPEPDLEINEYTLVRKRAGDADCLLRMRKHGGFGLRFPPEQTCARANGIWKLTAGSAPDERKDELVIDLDWTTPSGLAHETLRIPR